MSGGSWGGAVVSSITKLSTHKIYENGMPKIYWDARLMRWRLGRGLKPTANYAYSFSVRFVMVIYLWTYLCKKLYIISLWTHLYVKRLIMSGVILGQNCLAFGRLKQLNMIWRKGLLKSQVPFNSFL